MESNCERHKILLNHSQTSMSQCEMCKDWDPADELLFPLLIPCRIRHRAGDGQPRLSRGDEVHRTDSSLDMLRGIETFELP